LQREESEIQLAQVRGPRRSFLPDGFYNRPDELGRVVLRGLSDSCQAVAHGGLCGNGPDARHKRGSKQIREICQSDELSEVRNGGRTRKGDCVNRVFFEESDDTLRSDDGLYGLIRLDRIHVSAQAAQARGQNLSSYSSARDEESQSSDILIAADVIDDCGQRTFPS
jgi:hypothetical protein